MITMGRVKKVLPLLSGALALSGVVACSDLSDSNETCLTENNCTEVEIDPLQTPWGCLEVPPPSLPVPSGAPAAYALPVVEWAARTPLTGQGLTSVPCLVTPNTCVPPAGMPYKPEPGMLAGMPAPQLPMPLAAIPLREGFDGFLKFTVDEPGIPETQAYLPLAYYLGGPLVGQATVTDLAILMIRRNVLDSVIRESFERVGLDNAMEATVDRTNRGLVVLRAIDCQGAEARDVYFTINREGVIPFQLPVSRLPLAGVPPYTEPVYTDDLGTAGFANVLPGNVRVEAYRRGFDEPFGVGDLGVVAGQISVTVIRPRYFNTAALAQRPPVAPDSATQ